MIPRLKDIGPDPGLISDALLGVVAQRLLRRVCPHCSEPHLPTAAELDLLGITEAQARQGTWRKGKGCNLCFDTGYLGREAVMEVLNIDDAMRQAIYEGTIMPCDGDVLMRGTFSPSAMRQSKRCCWV